MRFAKFILLPVIFQSAFAFSQQAGVLRGYNNDQLPGISMSQGNTLLMGPKNKISNTILNSVQWMDAGDADEFKVYPDLSLDYIRKYNFTITPSYEVNGQTHSLPDGWYYLKAMILKPKLQRRIETFDEITDQYVTGAERIVRSKGGIISTLLEIPFPTLAPTTYKNRLFFEIIPIEQDKIKLKFDEEIGTNVVDTKKSQFINDPKQPTVVINVPFSPLSRVDSGRTADKTLASDFSFDQRFEISAIMAEGVRKLNERINQTKFLTPKSWAEKNKVALKYDDRVYRQYDSFRTTEELCQEVDKHIDYKLKQYKNTTVEIRARNSLKHFCNTEKNTLIFQKVQFVHPQSDIVLLNGSGYRNGGTTQISLSFTKGNNHSKSFDQFETSSTSINPIEMLGMKIPGLSFTRNYVINEGESQTAFAGGMFVENFTMNVRRISLTFKVSDSRTCYLLKLNQKHSYFSKPENAIQKKYLEDAFGRNENWGGHLVCRTQRTPSVIKESYFHIVPSLSDVGIADGTDPRNQFINMTLRGYQDYNNFKYQVRENLAENYKGNPAVMPDDVLTSTVAYETTPGIYYMPTNLERPKPGIIERTFFDKEKLEFN